MRNKKTLGNLLSTGPAFLQGEKQYNDIFDYNEHGIPQKDNYQNVFHLITNSDDFTRTNSNPKTKKIL